MMMMMILMMIEVDIITIHIIFLQEHWIICV